MAEAAGSGGSMPRCLDWGPYWLRKIHLDHVMMRKLCFEDERNQRDEHGEESSIKKERHEQDNEDQLSLLSSMTQPGHGILWKKRRWPGRERLSYLGWWQVPQPPPASVTAASSSYPAGGRDCSSRLLPATLHTGVTKTC